MEHETLFPLLCETANGNKAAFAELYKLTSPQLYAVVLKLLKRPELADEATQDVLRARRHQRDTAAHLHRVRCSHK